MRDYRELKVWERGHELTLEVYRVTRAFPKDELYGLVSQVRRAASSVPANIAEGCGRTGDKELARFMTIASGSAFELDYHFLLARDLGYLQDEVYQALHTSVTEIRRMLNAFIQKLTANS